MLCDKTLMREPTYTRSSPFTPRRPSIAPTLLAALIAIIALAFAPLLG